MNARTGVWLIAQALSFCLPELLSSVCIMHLETPNNGPDSASNRIEGATTSCDQRGPAADMTRLPYERARGRSGAMVLVVYFLVSLSKEMLSPALGARRRGGYSTEEQVTVSQQHYGRAH